LQTGSLAITSVEVAEEAVAVAAAAETHTVKVADQMAMAAVRTVTVVEQTMAAIAGAAAVQTVEAAVGKNEVRPVAIGVVLVLVLAFGPGTAAQPESAKRAGLDYGTRKAVTSCP
jgi:hypothetical protein